MEKSLRVENRRGDHSTSDDIGLHGGVQEHGNEVKRYNLNSLVFVISSLNVFSMLFMYTS